MTELEATRKLFMLQGVRKYTKTLVDRYINGTSIQDDECRLVIVCEGICVCVFTFSASSGTVSSPFTTVNRLVCETGRLRKLRAQVYTNTHTE